ncbi:MAG: cystatin domain-containing protein [Pseudomonadota bacterium]
MIRGAFLALIAATLIVAGCVSSDDSTSVPGGYSEVSTSDPGVNDAARFAVMTRADNTGEIIDLQQVFQAEQQVVAGLNYRMKIGVIQGGRNGVADVVVYRDLQGNYSLTSWAWDQNPDINRPRLL